MTESAEPIPIGEIVDEAVLHLMGEHLAAYHREKERHREALKNIERIHKLARSRLKRLYGPVKERIEADIEPQVRGADAGGRNRHQKNVAAIGEKTLPGQRPGGTIASSERSPTVAPNVRSGRIRCPSRKCLLGRIAQCREPSSSANCQRRKFGATSKPARDAIVAFSGWTRRCR